MKVLTQDNFDPFQPIGLPAARLVERCEQQKEDRERQTGRRGADDENTDRDGEDVERELEEIRARSQWRNWIEFVRIKGRR